MLKFKLSELKPIVRHAKDAPTHRLLYGDPKSNVPAIWLVKDSGVYIMSNGDPAQPNPAHATDKTQSTLLVCYAQGHDPRHADTWDADRAECGGDDFGDIVSTDLDGILGAIDRGYQYANVKVTPSRFTMTFSMR